jgi:TRAP-type uncharacterized transport system fused permease subunit
MAAHMFVFYFSVISNITPPVAVSCFAAAPLAGANPTKVGITSFRLAIAAYIVPFVFCFQPTLVLEGPIKDILADTALCAYAIFAVCIALSGYWQHPVAMWRRSALVAISVGILWPTSMLVNLTGVVLLTVLLFPDMKSSWEKIKAKKKEKKEEGMLTGQKTQI